FRYVSLSFGVGRYRPHAAAQVLANGYGDCKDKAALLIALLRACGIPADFALLSTASRLQRAVPAVQGFDHAIVAVPDGSAYQFLDATVPERYGALPGDAGRWALLARPAGAAGPALVRIPPERATEEETWETDNIQALADGDLRARCVFRLSPLLGLFSRLALHLTPAADRAKIENLFARATASGVHLISFQATPWPGLDQAFTMHTVRRMTAEADVLKPPFSVPLWWHITATALPAPSHRRRHPLRLDLLLPAYDQVIHLALPAGFVPVLPAATTLDRGFARFSLHYSFDPRQHVLTAEGELLWLQRTLPAAQVGAYQSFEAAVGNAEAGSIGLTLAPSAAPGALAASLRQLQADLNQGNNADAVALGQALVAAAPSNVAAREEVAAAWLGEGKDQQALAVLQPLAVHPPASGGVDGLLAQAHLGLGQAAAALPEVQRQLQATPYDAAITGLEGRIFDALHRRAEAVPAYARAAQLAPAAPEWHYRLGLDQLTLGQRAVAEANFATVAAASVTTAREWIGMARAELASGAPAPDASSWAEQGLAQEDAALASLDWSQVSAAETQAMARLPAAVELCARLQAGAKRWASAVSLGRLAVALNPANGTWVRRLAEWTQRAGGPAAALADWAYLVRQPELPPTVLHGAMQGLLGAYHALPQRSSLPVDLYLAAHPDLAQPRFGGLGLSPQAPNADFAKAWISGGHVASVVGYLPPAERQALQAAVFPDPVVDGSPLSYVLTLEPGSKTAVIVPHAAPLAP
ncbi:MAG: transglutaminase domain-containing protein, partial [Terriglobales bacterium]